MAKGTEEVAAALEKAIADVDVVTSTTGEEATETAPEGKTQKRVIPYERFAEVIAQKNTLQEQIKAIESEKSEVQSSVKQLTDVLTKAQSDVQTLNNIKNMLHSDNPKAVEAVKIVDAYLKGELEEIVEDETLEPDQAVQQAKALLAKTKDELENQTQDIRADLIIQRADTLADKWLGALPQEYNEKDREIVAKLWTQMVDWETIEGNPSALDGELAQRFQEAIDTYGVPRGALLDPNQVEFVEEDKTPAVSTPEEELRALVATHSGKFSAWNADKKGPELSDEDFSRLLANAAKIANRS